MQDNELLYEPQADILSDDISNRIQEANVLLDEMYPDKDKDGYRLYNGKHISFEILASSGSQDTVSYLQRQFQKIGIDLVFKAAGSTPETTYLYRSNFDLTIQSVILSMANADVMYRAHFVTTERSSNYGKYQDDALTESIEQMRYTLNRDRKVELIKELQIEVAETYYKIPLYSADVLSVARTDRFTGYVETPGSTVFNNDTLKNLKQVGAS